MRILDAIRHAVLDDRNGVYTDTAAEERIRSRDKELSGAVSENITVEGVQEIKAGNIERGIYLIELAAQLRKGELSLLRALGVMRENGNGYR